MTKGLKILWIIVLFFFCGLCSLITIEVAEIVGLIEDLISNYVTWLLAFLLMVGVGAMIIGVIMLEPVD